VGEEKVSDENYFASSREKRYLILIYVKVKESVKYIY